MAPNVTRAAKTESRDYAISVDGKPAGAYTMTLTRSEDGAVTVSCQAEVHVTKLVFHYTYTYRGTEVWKDGRLQRLSSTCNDDGKHFTVNAQAGPSGVQVTVNGMPHVARPDVWTTSFWRLPDAQLRTPSVPLLDADTGRDMAGTYQSLGVARLTVAGEVKNCAHYRVLYRTPTPVTADLWYDENERLAHQESVEDGHRTVLDLVRVRR
jgi:hypothetical protein